MITKFKLFESVNDGTPGVGDYVIINENSDTYSADALKFINNSIGHIWKSPDNSSNYFLVKYNDIPKDVLFYFAYSDYSNGLKIGNSILIFTENVKYWSKDEEELIPLIQATKYNL